MPYTTEELLAWKPKKRPEEAEQKPALTTEELLAWKPRPQDEPAVLYPGSPSGASPEQQAASVMSQQLGGVSVPTVAGGVLAGGAALTSMGYRVGELLPEKWGGKFSRERADWFANYSDALVKATEVAGEQGAVERGATQALRSGVSMLAAGPAGIPATIGMGVADQMNSAVTEGREAGLKGKELGAYVGRQGMIEGVTTGLFQKFGIGGMEKVLPGAFAAARNGVRQGLNATWKAISKDTAKKVGRTWLEENAEELVIGGLQMWNDKYSGVDKSGWSLDQVARTFADTVSAVTWMTAGGAGPIHLVQNISAGKAAEIERAVITTAESGKVPTRKQWKEWGLDPEQGKTAKSRAEGVQQVATELQQQYASQRSAAEETQPEAPQEAVEAPVQPEAATQEAAGQLSTRLTEPVILGQSGILFQGVVDPSMISRHATDLPRMAAHFAEQKQAIGAPSPGTAGSGVVRVYDAAIPGIKFSTENEYILPASAKPFAEIPAAEFRADPAAAVAKYTQEAAMPETWQKPGPPTPKGEVAQFIESTAGRIGVSAEALSKPIGFVKHAMQRFMTSRGELPQAVYKEKIKRDGKLSKIQRSMAYDVRDYRQAVAEVYTKQLPTKEEIRAYGMALRGEVPMEAVPPPLRKQIGKMRSNIDAMSRRAIELGAVEGPLVGTVLDNMGVYVYRGYQVHTDPNWADKVPVETRNRAKAWLREEYPDRADAEIDGLIEHLLYEGKAADTPIAALASKLGKKDISILEQRRAIPRELRELWGEQQDPVTIYAQTVTRLGNLIENHRFLEQVRSAGLGTFFSETPIIGEYGELKVRIAADESSAMHPLNGLYTTPEIRDAFIRATEAKHHPTWLQYMLAANAAVKISKTIGSAMTHVRNMVGNVGFAIANGHWRVGSAPGSFRSVLKNLLMKPDTEYRSYFLRAVELGIVAQDVHASEFRSYIEDASMKDLDEFAFDVEKRRAYKTKAGLKKVAATIADIYQAEDDVWKLYAFENEKARYAEAFPEWSAEQLETHAAQVVADTYPTYSKVPEGIKALRRFPVLGTFVSFPAEVIRTTYHTALLAKQELANPRTRIIGAERAAGLATSVTLASAVATASRFLVGIGSDDDKDLRWFVPPWQKNSAFMYLAKQANGVFRYVDLAYIDPHNYLLTPVRALFAGQDLKDGLWNSLTDFMEPYGSEEILASKVLDISRNSKKSGGQVYNPQDSVDQQAQDIVAHLWSAFEPGTLTSAKRIVSGARGVTTQTGRKFNPTVETIALVSGQRIQEVDIVESIKFRAKDYSRQWREAQSIWLGTITNRGSVSDSDIRSAYQRADSARQSLFRDMSEAAQAAVRLGVDQAEVSQSLDIGGISDDLISDLYSGVYAKLQLSNKHANAIWQANRDEAERRLKVIDEIISSQESPIVQMGDKQEK